MTEDSSEFISRYAANGRGELGYFGPTYNAAKAATIAPAYFVCGSPKTPEELANHRTSSKINAGIDLLLNHMRKDEINQVPIGKKAKFTIHCDSRQVKTGSSLCTSMYAFRCELR